MENKVKFKNLQEEKEEIQRLFLQTITELYPKVWAELPFDSFKQLFQDYTPLDGVILDVHNKAGWLLPRMIPLLLQDPFSDTEFLTVFRKVNQKHFLEFKQELLVWANKYCLKKDWIFNSVLLGMSSHLTALEKGKNSQLRAAYIVNGFLHIYLGEQPKTEWDITDSFDFKHELFNEFEHRVLLKLKTIESLSKGKIVGYKHNTKPLDLNQKIEWLVYWNIGNYTASEIVQTILKVKSYERDYNQKIRYFYKERDKLEVFDLPISKKNQKTAKDFG